MRRAAAAIFVLAAAVGLMGAGQPAPMRPVVLSDQQKDDLDKVSDYLNGMHSLEGDFIQIDPNGEIDQGEFFLDKPGRMRFEYNPPAPILIVSDGSTVAVQNRRLNTLDHYPLWTTPLRLLLSEHVNLRENQLITDVVEQGDALVVQAKSERTRFRANIALTFSWPELELRQWTVIDDQGLSTTVSLREVKQNVALDPSLFVLPKKLAKDTNG
ncbi:MAG TPA: outer membrane lipoprotein carrier protein LolA [Rhizomicrobium sp.]|nr:outer membrane lipoprotein carrier protein LolA [Rhizomicrobium sp.]